MSAIELRNFERQLDLLSFTERLAIIDYLVKSMQEILREQSSVTEGKEDWVDDLFALMDSAPLNTNGIKWTREELYER